MPNMADVTLLKRLSERLALRAKRLRAMRSMPEQAIKVAERDVNSNQEMEKIVQARFDNESSRSYGGRAWAPRVDPGDGHPILNDTGRLLTAARRAVRGSYRIKGTRFHLMMVGTPYAMFIQQGTGKMPRRQFFLDPDRRELRAADYRASRAMRRWLRRRM